MNKQLITLKPYAALFIRLAFGYHLIQYTYAEVFGLTAGSSNAVVLGNLGVPFPYFLGWLHILTEFPGGIALITGFKIRIFAFPLIVNFIAALALVHLNNPYKESFVAIQLLAVSSFFLLNGAGKLSIADRMEQRELSQ